MSRIQRLIDASKASPSRYVLYWMQASPRVLSNHALAEAVRIANETQLPLLVLFVLDPTYPNANIRHFAFLLEGLAETQASLQALSIPFVFREGQPNLVLNEFAKDAHTIVIDVGYTRIQRSWRKTLYQDLMNWHPHVSLISVEANVVVPVRTAMDKAAYGAYVLRPRIHRLLEAYREPAVLPNYHGLGLHVASSRDLSAWNTWIQDLPVNKDVLPSTMIHGGAKEAFRRLRRFLEERLPHYLESADPSLSLTSELSAYLHFGQIGVHQMLDELDKVRPHVASEACDAFFEQLVVRRELAVNFVFYNEGYDRFETMSEPWAYLTMRRHAGDAREFVYSLEAFEQSQTHDPYWNACMTDMRAWGTMPNYMRMYWGKKIIEWSNSHEEAFQTMLYFNDKYFLDGRDPNGYAGIAWCFGRHDRAWTERPVFGTLRYMNAAGLKRKFRIDDYVAQVQERCKKQDSNAVLSYNETKE